LRGSLGVLSRYVATLRAPDYTALNRRVNGLDINIDEGLIKSSDPVYIALGSTGIKVHNSGDWIRRRLKARKGYLKIHIAVNVKTRQIVGLRAARECVHEGRVLEKLVEDSSKRVICDGAYDSSENLSTLAEKDIESVIKVRRNAVPKFSGCPPRMRALAMQRGGSDLWREIYSLRWIAESASSWLKRIFGE